MCSFWFSIAIFLSWLKWVNNEFKSRQPNMLITIWLSFFAYIHYKFSAKWLVVETFCMQSDHARRLDTVRDFQRVYAHLLLYIVNTRFTSWKKLCSEHFMCAIFRAHKQLCVRVSVHDWDRSRLITKTGCLTNLTVDMIFIG